MIGFKLLVAGLFIVLVVGAFTSMHRYFKREKKYMSEKYRKLEKFSDQMMDVTVGLLNEEINRDEYLLKRKELIQEVSEFKEEKSFADDSSFWQECLSIIQRSSYEIVVHYNNQRFAKALRKIELSMSTS